MIVYFDNTDFFIGIVLLFAILPVLWWKRRSFSYLFFFSIFWFYLLIVISLIAFPIVINPEYTGSFRLSVNFIPFYFGECQKFPELCIRNAVVNIFLTVPFGFGIGFLVKIKPKHIVWLAFAVGLTFELTQLIVSLVFRSGFRTTDINDVILNGVGVLIGYALFRLFAWLYLKIADYFNLKHRLIFADIYEIALQTRVTEKPKID